VIYTTHYMEEAERLCDSIAIVDHGRIIAQGTKDELVAQSFGSRSDVLMRLDAAAPNAAAWTASRGGTLQDGVAHFPVDRPSDIASLLDAAARDGLNVIDLVLRRPNLESVFLQLTGRTSDNDRRHRSQRLPRTAPRSRSADSLLRSAGRLLQHLCPRVRPHVGQFHAARERPGGGRRSQRGFRAPGPRLAPERALATDTRPEPKPGEPAPPEYTAATAEAAVKRGTAPVALIIPAGLAPIQSRFAPAAGRKPIRILHDSSNPVAAQMVAGLLQRSR